MTGNFFIKLARWLNLLDSEQRLSITNIAVWITLVKLAISPLASITEAGSLLVALSSYAHKRYVNNQAKDDSADVQTQINSAITDTTTKLEALESKVSVLAIQAGIKRN